MSMFVKIPEKNKGDFQNLALSHFRLIPNGVFPFFKEDNCEKGGKDAQTNEKEHRIRLTAFRKTIFKSSLNLKSRFCVYGKGQIVAEFGGQDKFAAFDFRALSGREKLPENICGHNRRRFD